LEPGRESRRLADALRDLRITAGLSGAALGEALGWSQSRVSRLENGRTRASAEDVAAWADAAGASAEARAGLITLAEEAAAELHSWWRVHSRGLAPRQQEVSELEASSARIQRFDPIVLPGLLQTAEYARRIILMNAEVSGQTDVPAAVAARLQRQSVLFDEFKSFEYVLMEAALRWRPSADPAVMRAQADRLLSVSTLANVSIRVLPADAVVPVLPMSGFGIFGVPDEPVVLVELLTGQVLTSARRDVEIYSQAFTRLQAAALADEEAHALIRRAMIP
jgi:transcriptional regulator with XRE-family HTH domain